MLDYQLPRLSSKKRTELWKEARRIMRQIGHSRRHLSETQFWAFRVMTDDGRTELTRGKNYLPGYNYRPGLEPPVDRRRIRHYQRPKVLFIATEREHREMPNADILAIAAKHGLKNPRITRTAMWSIWISFFGRVHMLDSKTLRIPQLIISTGRHRTDGGELDTTKRDKDIAEKWSIPIEFISVSEISHQQAS